MTTFQYSSFIVPDLDAAVEFFTAYFDFQQIATAGPLQSENDDSLNLIYGVPERATGRAVMLQNGPAKLELVEWITYGEALNPLRESSIPGCSLSFEVADLEMMVAQLNGVRGLRFLEASPNGFVYCQTPFGIQLRLSGRTVLV